MAARSTGPQPCDFLVVGEAFGKDEEFLGEPFVGASGKELRRMLQEAGFDAGLDEFGRIKSANQNVRMTNVFMVRPPDNNVDRFCGKRADVGKSYAYPPLAQGKYILPEYLGHLDNLAEEIRATNPRVIIALGNVPCWALLRRTGITKLRGSVFPCELVEGYSVLPTFHPANILRDWSNRPIAVGDIIKAKRFVDEGFNQPHRELWLDPTFEEVEAFVNDYILCDEPPRILSFDIETHGELITCIGFAVSKDRAITIPFYDPGKPDGNYWEDPAVEARVWRLVKEVLESDIPKLGQNGLYDIQYLYKAGIRVQRYLHDTMIRHHSLYPELEKGLGFMGTLYTDEAPWKLLRDRNKDNFKIDDE